MSQSPTSNSTPAHSPSHLSPSSVVSSLPIQGLAGWSDYLHFVKDLVAGGVAGAVSRTVVSPLERMKILFQVQGAASTPSLLQGVRPQDSQYRGVLHTLIRIGKEEGWQGYFKGNGTNIIRIVPYSAVQFASYEKYKRLLLKVGQKELDVYRTLAAGALAGITSVTCTYPLDIIRTRLSLQDAEGQPMPAQTAARSEPRLWRQSRILACGVAIVREEGGWTSLYRGLLPTVLGIAPYVALNFTTYEMLKRRIVVWMARDPTVQEKLACGGAAGALAQSVTYPLDVLRRRLQVHGSPLSPYRYAGLFSAIQSMAREEGWLAFYRGMLPNLLKVVPSMSVSFVIYELAKKLL